MTGRAKRVAVFLAAFAVCVVLFIISRLMSNDWILVLALVLVPILGWLARRANWL